MEVIETLVEGWENSKLGGKCFLFFNRIIYIKTL